MPANALIKACVERQRIRHPRAGRSTSDLTINALYCDPLDETVLDQIDGGRDISARLIRVIGDPVKRYQEDPVRMLRVVRFAAKLQFDIEADTEAGIGKCAALLTEIPPARLFDEFLKLFMAGYGKPTLLLLLEHGLLHCLCPEAASLIASEPQYRTLVTSAMANTDQRVKDDRPVTPAFAGPLCLASRLVAMRWPNRVSRPCGRAQCWPAGDCRPVCTFIPRRFSRSKSGTATG